jgi:hypothetical protein
MIAGLQTSNRIRPFPKAVFLFSAGMGEKTGTNRESFLKTDTFPLLLHDWPDCSLKGFRYAFYDA